MLATFQCVYFFLQEVLNVLLSVYTDKNQANEFEDDWLDHGARVKDAEGRYIDSASRCTMSKRLV